MSPPGGPEPPNRRTTLVAMLAIVLLGIAGWWIAARLHQANSIQDCVMQGRRNCAPISK